MARLALRLAIPLLLAGCAGLPLADSPFQRIARSGAPPGGRLLVAIRAERVPSYHHAAAAVLAPARVRAAACAGLGETRFRCVRPDGEGRSTGKPAYVVRLEYDVADARGLLIEDDPAGDAAYFLRWGFRVTRAGEAAPLFESGFREETFQFWRFEVEAWMTRYFSE